MTLGQHIHISKAKWCQTELITRRGSALVIQEYLWGPQRATNSKRGILGRCLVTFWLYTHANQKYQVVFSYFSTIRRPMYFPWKSEADLAKRVVTRALLRLRCLPAKVGNSRRRQSLKRHFVKPLVSKKLPVDFLISFTLRWHIGTYIHFVVYIHIGKAKIMAIITLLVRCLPVEEGNSRRGKRFGHNFVFTHACWYFKMLPTDFHIFYHKIACTFLNLLRDFDVGRSLAVLSSAMQRLNRPAPAAVPEYFLFLSLFLKKLFN